MHVHHDLTQEELAQLVGASRETVNKALADFAARGWIRLEPRSVTILDVERSGAPGEVAPRSVAPHPDTLRILATKPAFTLVLTLCTPCTNDADRQQGVHLDQSRDRQW